MTHFTCHPVWVLHTSFLPHVGRVSHMHSGDDILARCGPQGQRALKPSRSWASGSQEQIQFSLLALSVPDSYLHGWGMDLCVGNAVPPQQEALSSGQLSSIFYSASPE